MTKKVQQYICWCIRPDPLLQDNIARYLGLWIAAREVHGMNHNAGKKNQHD
jgi:hypothetical protein